MKAVIASLAAIVVIVAHSAAAQTPAAATNADVLGKWDVMFSTQEGPIAGQMNLKKEGEQIVGIVVSPAGENAARAEVKGQSLTVWFTYLGHGTPMAIAMNGTVDGTAMKGTFTADGNPAGEWTGTRDTKESKEAKDLTGTWNVTAELPNMTATPTIVLKQDGEKLTGDYISAQYGKFALAGTVKGADVTFSFGMNIEGTAITATYSGKIEKDELKGSVSYGDMMSGTFIARRAIGR